MKDKSKSYKKKGYSSGKKKAAWGRKVGLGTKPQLMNSLQAAKRYHGVSTKVFYFKNNSEVFLNDQPYQYFEVRTNYLYSANPNGWAQCCEMFDQFKILGIVYELYPASVGIEPLGETTNIQTPLYLNRGNHCLWIDQRFDGVSPVPTSINNIICTGSARLINARRPYRLSMWRPQGKPNWGSCKAFADPTSPVPDPWTGVINHLIEGGSVQPQGVSKTIYYRMITFKVMFRGRQDD